MIEAAFELQLMNRGVPIKPFALSWNGLKGVKEYGGLAGFMRKFRADPEGFMGEFTSRFGPAAAGDAMHARPSPFAAAPRRLRRPRCPSPSPCVTRRHTPQRARALACPRMPSPP